MMGALNSDTICYFKAKVCVFFNFFLFVFQSDSSRWAPLEMQQQMLAHLLAKSI